MTDEEKHLQFLEVQASALNVVALLKKLHSIQKSVNYFKKDAKGFQFQYVKSSQILGAVRVGMDDHGVILEPRNATIEIDHDHETRKGDKWYHSRLSIEWFWVDVETGAERGPFMWFGQGLDDAEKGPGKAATYCEKMFILKYFHIATDDLDPDSFQRKNSTFKENKPAPKPTQAAPRTPKPQPRQTAATKPKDAGMTPRAPEPATVEQIESITGFTPPTKAQVNRLKDLASYAEGRPKCGNVSKALFEAIDQDEVGNLTQGAAGATIGKAKKVLTPLGWEAPDSE